MTGLLIVAALAALALAATLPGPYRGCRRWAARHRWQPAHRAANSYRPRHRQGAVARPARLPLAVWSAQLAGGAS